jgi:hypothetical protein
MKTSWLGSRCMVQELPSGIADVVIVLPVSAIIECHVSLCGSDAGRHAAMA